MKNHGVQLDVILNGSTILSATLDYSTFNRYYADYPSVTSYGVVSGNMMLTIDLDDFTNATINVKKQLT